MRQLDLSLVIPCYNEGKIFEESINALELVLNNSKLSYEIIFVDDKSKDETAGTIRKAVRSKKNYSAIFHENNEGRGKTLIDGIKRAQGKIVGFIDIDIEVSPVYIPYFVNRILDGDADVITGQRIYKEELKSIHRIILSKGYSMLVRKFLGIPLKDTETGYKFFNRIKILPEIKKTANYHWFWDTEIMTYAYLDKLRIKEIPVLFVRRFDKQSTLNVFNDTLDYFINLLRFKQKLNKEYKGLRS